MADLRRILEDARRRSAERPEWAMSDATKRELERYRAEAKSMSRGKNYAPAPSRLPILGVSFSMEVLDGDGIRMKVECRGTLFDNMDIVFERLMQDARGNGTWHVVDGDSRVFALAAFVAAAPENALKKKLPADVDDGQGGTLPVVHLADLPKWIVDAIHGNKFL